ncbi:uncharacterized protein LOC110990457 [Acanthaster planci]|uniref:Uncharacterized protein LOC110990457 n=1 Tax=Acanthaster planci TaxID=133434 RepID=A0A8B8A5D6_ACAPL|nr:uncharacterized protein LOC110990457 [Acanthaster planci]XP_022111160.1 uncharacterized protein LOC110990457 [Acanthaster planci]XP_022111161.1 uncharacterized protein LOC110990457 [Acanthaster planci]
MPGTVPKVLNNVSCGRIARKIGNKLLPLALELGLENTEIQAIKVRHPHDLFGQNAEVLSEFVSRNGENPNILARLLTALREDTVGLNNLAREVEQYARNQVQFGDQQQMGGPVQTDSLAVTSLASSTIVVNNPRGPVTVGHSQDNTYHQGGMHSCDDSQPHPEDEVDSSTK